METIEDVVREMNDAAHLAPSAVENDGHLLTDWYYDDECQGWLNHYADRIEKACSSMEAEKARIIAELNEVRELNRKCCDENERLKCALQPVLDCDRHSCDCGAEYAVKCTSAVNEAQRIWKEGETK